MAQPLQIKQLHMTDIVPVVDIFAGPGGLGEGFAAFESPKGSRPFRIRLSIEMDEYAHRTLLLRAFFRQFDPGCVPSAYYEYLRGESRWAGATCEDLLEVDHSAAARARSEAWREELRPSIADEVDRRIRLTLGPRRKHPAWVLVGGPPCQAYSLVGRARMLGKDPVAFYKDKRHTLYREYLRLLAKHAPSVFIMENVQGLLSATTKTGRRIFELITRDLQRPPGSTLRYRLFALSLDGNDSHTLQWSPVDARQFVVKSERHGIPQARHRLIVLGVLESEFGSNLRLSRHLPTYGRMIACRDAIGDLPRLRSGVSREKDSPERWKTAVASASRSEWLECAEANGQSDVAAAVRRAVERATIPRNDRGGRFVQCDAKPRFETEWYVDRKLDGVCNHESRSHRPDDLHRYLFVSSFGHARKYSPDLSDFPRALLPAHTNVSRALKTGLFNDRFRVQLGGEPATTITSHISKDGHYYIHFDASQCRSLTVREAARIQTFPDNYFFEGPRTEQYRQVGNAVPPLLAREIAGIVWNGITSGWR